MQRKNIIIVICGYCDVNYNDAKNTNIPKIVINKFSDLIYISRACSKPKMRKE